MYRDRSRCVAGSCVPLNGLPVLRSFSSCVGLCIAILFGFLRQPRHRDHPLALAHFEDDHTLAAPPGNADTVDRNADYHSTIGHKHDLVIVSNREDSDDRIVAAAQIHVVDALPAASGNSVIIGRGPDAVPLLGDAQHELLALGEIGMGLIRDRSLLAAVFVVGIRRRFRYSLALFAHLPAALSGEAQIRVPYVGADLLVPQDRHRDHLIVAEEADATHADGTAAGEDTNVADRKADRFAIAGSQKHIVGLGAGRDRDEPVIRVLALKFHGYLAVGADVGEVA